MKFKKLLFKKGLNMTVRRGIAYAFSDEITFPVYSVDDTKPLYGNGNIVYTKVKRFIDITCEDLEKMHDPEFRTDQENKTPIENDKAFFELGVFMNDVYEDFDPSEIVTLIFFNFEKCNIFQRKKAQK